MQGSETETYGQTGPSVEVVLLYSFCWGQAGCVAQLAM